MPAPTAATATCIDSSHRPSAVVPDLANGCACGFSAYTTRLHALRRNARTTPLLDVSLTGLVFETIAGQSLLGAGQRVDAVTLFKVCECGAAASHLACNPRDWEDVDGGCVEFRCNQHLTGTQPLELDEVAGLADFRIEVASSDLNRWISLETRQADVSPGRCACAYLSEIAPDRGLAWCLRQFWTPVGKAPDGRMRMECGSCRREWLYTRTGPLAPTAALNQT